MRFTGPLLLAVLCLIVGGPALADDTSAVRDLVARTFANLYGYSSIQRIHVTSQRSDGREFTRTVSVIRRGSDSGLNRLLARFVDPPDLRGVGILLEEREDFSYDAFLYQPILKRVRRVSVAQRNDPFFGTDVYFEDLESKRAAQWSSELLRREVVGERAATVIELRPDGFPSGYERIVAWFDDELPVMLRAEFYRSGKLLKTLDVDPAQIADQDGYGIPRRMVFRSATGSVTTLDIAEVEIRDEIAEERFSAAALQFGDDRRDVR